MIPPLTFAVVVILQACVFLCLIAWQERAHAKERQDLYNRLQAGSLGEYRAATSPGSAPRTRQPVRERLEDLQRRQRTEDMQSDTGG